MAALHDGAVAPLQFVGRQVLGTVEITGEVVGDVVEIGKTFLRSALMNLFAKRQNRARRSLHHQPFHQLTAHLREYAVRNEIVEVIRQIDRLTSKDSVAEFGELTDNVLTRRLLRQLVFCRHHNDGRARRQLEAPFDSTQRQTDRHLALSTGLGQQALHLLVIIAIEPYPGLQRTGHPIGIDAIAHHPIGTETLQLSLRIDKAQAVAIGKTGHTRHIEGVATQFLHHADKLTDGLRGVE